MVRLIIETPILTGQTGQDAKRFFDKMNNVKPESPEEIARIKKSTNKIVFVLD